MCGIAGILTFRETPAERLGTRITAMTNAIAYRGPAIRLPLSDMLSSPTMMPMPD